MSLNVLKAYITKCNIEGLEPTWEGLREFKENI